MTALVVHLDRVRRAVEMAARLSPHESPRTVAARIVQDIRNEASGEWERVHERAMQRIRAGGRLEPPVHFDCPHVCSIDPEIPA